MAKAKVKVKAKVKKMKHQKLNKLYNIYVAKLHTKREMELSI